MNAPQPTPAPRPDASSLVLVGIGQTESFEDFTERVIRTLEEQGILKPDGPSNLVNLRRTLPTATSGPIIDNSLSNHQKGNQP